MRPRSIITIVFLSCSDDMPKACTSNLDALMIRCQPAPRAGTIAASQYALPVNLSDDFAIAREQRLGRAHRGAQRQLAFAEPVGAVFRKLLGAAGSLVSATTGAIGAFVHLAARTKIADHRILRRPERAGIEAIAAADAQILVVQHDAVFGRIDADDRANGRTGRVDAMHAGHRYRALARFSVIDGNDAPPVDSPRHLILVLGGSDAGVAIDAAVRVAKELHPCHRSLLYAALIWHSA